MRTVKPGYLFFCLFLFLPLCSAQNVPDFVIAETGRTPSLALDSSSNLNVVFYIKEGSAFIVLDSAGQITKPAKRILQQGLSAPVIELNKNIAAVAGRLISATFNSYIYAGVINIETDSVYVYSGRINDPNFDVNRFNPDICFTDDSTFIIVWNERRVFSEGIYGQLLTTSMRKVGTNILLSDNGDEGIKYGTAKAISLSENGNIALLWQDDHTGGAKIYCRLISPDGTPLNSSFIVSEDPGMEDVYYLNADNDSAGNFAVIWCAEKTPERELQWRWFDKNGNALGPTEIISSEDVNSYSTVDVSIDIDGSSVAAWEKSEGDYYSLYCQRFTPERKPLGKPFQLSSNNTDYKKQINPDIILKNGKIYSVWAEYIDSANFIIGNIIDFHNPPVSVYEENIPAANISFQLFQNYPNPFNSGTIISYSLFKNQQVTIKIYDVLGREISILENSFKEKGTYKLEFNGNDLPSGIYLYKINTGGKYDIKKMILMK
jgi:hypothetical protein